MHIIDLKLLTINVQVLPGEHRKGQMKIWPFFAFILAGINEHVDWCRELTGYNS